MPRGECDWQDQCAEDHGIMSGLYAVCEDVPLSCRAAEAAADDAAVGVAACFRDCAGLRN